MAYLGARPTTNFRVAPTKDTFTWWPYYNFWFKCHLIERNALQVFVENVRQEPGSGKAYTL